MVTVERDIERVLTLLRNKIRERGLTQLQVQDALGWGRSYISQLLTKQKSLRVEQVLRILHVIGVTPAEFFGELFQAHPPYAQSAVASDFQLGATTPRVAAVDTDAAGGDLVDSYKELSSLVRGLLRVLVERGVIAPEDFEAAVRASEGSPNWLPSKGDGLLSN